MTEEEKENNRKVEFREDLKLKIKFKSNQPLTHPENLPQITPNFVISGPLTPAAFKMQ